MKKLVIVRKDILGLPKVTENKSKSKLPTLSYDQEIAKCKEISLNHPNERHRVFNKDRMGSLILEKDLVIKASNAIIKSAIKATIKDIGILYPSILTWKGDYQHCQIRTKRWPFSEEAIEKLGKNVKSINCLCKDGITRTFKVKKIEAFTAKCRSGARAARCVNVYYSVKDSSEVRSPFQIEYSVN